MENYYNCIYCYINKINNKKYIGQAVDFNRRYKGHINSSYNEKHKGYNLPLHCAIRKYGIENFKIKILIENLQTKEKLDYWEKYYIVEFDTLAKNGKGYNLASGGEGGNTLAGKTEEEMKEIRRKWHETMNNKTDKELVEIRRKNSKAHKGENHPMYGKQHSEETKAKISKAHKGKKHESGMKGKKHSIETKEKISNTLNNKSDEEKAERNNKISKKIKGKNHPKSKRVGQFDLDDNLIKIWDYAKEISNELGYSYSALKNHLNNKCKKNEFKGFIWKYLD